MSEKIGWRFPPTNGGISTGINDPGMAHFSGEPMDSLARETIQNSLDAQDDLDRPVHVSFEVISLDIDEVGRKELSETISYCMNEISEAEQTQELRVLQEARACVRERKIACLSISDRNTTGLKGQNWRALVKTQGFSYKPGVEGAGGSHGIGKYAPFAVSRLRTVFYWTCYEEDDALKEKFQGKSVLISHRNVNGLEAQGTGFFGVKDGCLELSESIPAGFGVYDKNLAPLKGTNVTVIGFRETENWRRRIARSVIASFFYAIATRRLTVIIDFDENDELLELNESTLPNWIEYLYDSEAEDTSVSDSLSLEEARQFWTLSQKEPVAERQDADLGHCKLWIETGEDLPSKVALVRRTGMLITTKQEKLIRFPRFRDFAALCFFEDPNGNELLRQMENPRHDQFEPNRLRSEDRARGKRALKRVTDWIREEIRKQAGPPVGGEKEILTELASYLPDYHPEESIEDSGGESDTRDTEAGFAERITVSLKPARRRSTSRIPDDTDDDDNRGGAGTGNGGGTGGEEGLGSGTGHGSGGTGTRGSRWTRDTMSISAVRLLSVNEQRNLYKLSFLSNESGEAKLVLEEAGDSYVTHLTDIRAAGQNESLDVVRLRRGHRTEIEITADRSLEGMALRLSAVRLASGDDT